MQVGSPCLQGEPKGGGFQSLCSGRIYKAPPVLSLLYIDSAGTSGAGRSYTNRVAKVRECTGLESPLKGVGFCAVGIAGETPAFPASRVLGARASRSHDSRNALLGSSASRHARKKPTPLSSLRFPLLAGGTEPLRGSPREAGGTCRRGAIVNSSRAIGITQLSTAIRGQLLPTSAEKLWATA